MTSVDATEASRRRDLSDELPMSARIPAQLSSTDEHRLDRIERLVSIGVQSVKASRFIALLVSIAYALTFTGQGHELVLSLEGLSPLSTWLVFAAVLLWAWQSWYWSRLAIEIILSENVATRSRCSPNMTFRISHYSDAFGIIYVCLILTLAALQFRSVSKDGLAAILLISCVIFLVLLIANATRASIKRPSADHFGSALATVLPRGRLAGFTIAKGRFLRICASSLVSLAVLAVGMADPLLISEQLKTLGTLFLGFIFLTPIGTALTIATRNSRFPTLIVLMLLPFLAPWVYQGATVWLQSILVLALLFFALRRRLGVCVLLATGLMASVALPLKLRAIPHEVRHLTEQPTIKRCGVASPDDKGLTKDKEPADGRCGLKNEVERWRAAHSPEGKSRPEHIVFVSNAGGGLRAAYWSAAVLGRLEDCIPGFHSSIFSISAVSGGSLGAAVYTSLVKDLAVAKKTLYCNHHPLAIHERPLPSGEFQTAAAGIISGDLIAPIVASLLFRDIAQSLSPQPLFLDRAVALERGLERAWAIACEARRSISPCRDHLLFSRSFLALREGNQWVPSLFFNGTHQETGKRIITAHVKADRTTFQDSYDFYDLAGHDVSLSTAILNSARFPYISPAGTIVDRRSHAQVIRGHVLDGGYFENNGALTSQEAAEAALRELRVLEEHERPRPIFIELISDPELTEQDLWRPFTPAFDERATAFAVRYEPLDKSIGESPLQYLLGPALGLYATRSARGVLASKSLATFAHGTKGAIRLQFRLCSHMRPSPQLGWLLSRGSREAIDALLLGYERRKFEQLYPPTDTVTSTQASKSYLQCFYENQNNLAELIRLLAKR